MKREQQHWNDQINVLNNCRAMRHLIYFYSDMWPFQMITFNKYDRKIWFDANPSEGARRGDLEIRGKDQKSTYLLNKKEIASNTMIEKLEATIDKQQQEIDRKENVLNNTLNLYNDLKMRHAALQHRYNMLEHQYNMQMQYIYPNNIGYNEIYRH
eukprot:301526_1